MDPRDRLNPKDVFTPDDFLKQRMLDYERIEEPKVKTYSPDLLLGVAFGVLCMVPVWMLVVVLVWVFS